MCIQLGAYQKDVSLRKRGAKKALGDFVAARKKLVELSSEVSTIIKSFTSSYRSSIRKQISVAIGHSPILF